MEHEHLSIEALDRMMALDRSEDQNRNLLHQIAVCPACRAVGGWLLDLHKIGLLPPRFGPVDVTLARSRVEAPHLWEILAPLPLEEQLALVRRDASRFVSWGLAELLCEESRAAAPDDADRAIELAELGVLVADSLAEDDPVEVRWVYQLRAWTWAHLGNAFRVRGDFRGADEAFSLSGQWREAGELEVGDALGYGPAILNLEASLRSDQRRFPEALDLLSRAFDAYLHGDPENRDPHLAGRVLVSKGFILGVMEEPEQAIAVLREAEPLVDPGRDPRLLLCLRHNLVDNLGRAGRFGEAEALLPEVRELSRRVGTPLDAVRLQWSEGRIAAGLGRGDEARQAFDAARREFLGREMAFDAALVSLEMAVLSIQEGETSEVKELAREMVEIFRAQDVHREALAALTVFQNAAAREAATADLAREIAAWLGKARRDPGLRWER
jgi:tetratricopeptide (TPR) repeat protein